MKSMTGFGAGRSDFRGDGKDGGSIGVEVRSVNQRHLDLRLSMPRELAAFEAEVRDRCRAAAARGRVEVAVSRSVQLEDGGFEVDEVLAGAVVRAAVELGERFGLSGGVEVAHLLAHPGILKRVDTSVVDAAEGPSLLEALDAALAQFEKARLREGAHLASDLKARTRRLGRLSKRFETRAKAGAKAARTRIRERLTEILGKDLDESRLAQEAAHLVERADVSEEIVRYRSHIEGLRELLADSEPVGRRIEFLLQEIGREVNTITSKSNDLGLTEAALEAKAELEKLREQVQNVE